MFANPTTRTHGFLLAGVLIALGVLFHLFHGAPRSLIGFLFFVAGPLVLFHYYHHSKQALSGESLWAWLKPALFISAIGVAIYGVFVFVLNGMIDGSYLLEVQQDALADIERRGLEGQAYEDAAKLAEIFSRPVPFAITISLQLWLAFAVLAMPLAAIIRRRALQD